MRTWTWGFGLGVMGMTLTPQQQQLVKDWQVDMTVEGSSYEVTFSWTHNHSEAVTIESEGASASGKVFQPVDDARCNGESDKVSDKDGQPYWMPRFYPREVPAEVTEKTGIKFASVDWQPCGHKDIVICHAESHYDFHLYYKTPEELRARMPLCDIGSASNPNLPICRDTSNPVNHDYFKLLNKYGNLPKSAQVSTAYTASSTEAEPYTFVNRDFNYCVDQSSAILQSGVHYGDSADTLEEWKSPVTIVGSHDCELMFFEPMVSWRWISNYRGLRTSWPGFKTKNIEYHNKTFKPLPTTWEVTVSPGCRDYNGDDIPDHKLAANGASSAEVNPCTLQIIVKGEVCSGAQCTTLPEADCVAGTRLPAKEIQECTSRAPYPTGNTAGADAGASDASSGTTLSPTDDPADTLAPATLAPTGMPSSLLPSSSTDSAGPSGAYNGAFSGIPSLLSLHVTLALSLLLYRGHIAL